MRWNWRSMPTTEYADQMPTAPDAYVNDVWNRQRQLYDEMWDYFSGDIFDEELENQSDDKKYPLAINLYEIACANHRAALLGEFTHDVLPFRVESKNADADHVEAKINEIMAQSGFSSLLLEGGLLCEVMGGVVYRVVYNPYTKQVYVRLISPDAFYPIWDPNDYHRILEVYIAHYIDARTASLRYNVSIGEDDGQALLLEHWTPDFYEVTIDGKPAYWNRGHTMPMSGPNIFKDPLTNRGIVPFEYFPRDRAGDFFGLPLGKNALRLQDEYNLRHTDLGDAVMTSTHKPMFLRGRPKGKRGLERLSRTELNDLGPTAPGRDPPEVFSVDAGEVPTQAVDWLDSLKGDARTSMYTPPVAYGEDEGSQRSALTLAFRMWPLTSAVRATRGYWSDSLESLCRKLIVVASSKKLGYNLEARHASYSYRFRPVWAPMLPRDREGEVNEVVVRKANGLISIETAINKLEDRDSDWVKAEVERIHEDADRVVERQAKMGPQDPFGGGGGGASNSGGKTSVPDK